MKIVVAGATGAIGKKVTAAFEQEHEVIKAASKSGDMRVDITSAESIEAFYKKIGAFDALVSAAGWAHAAPLENTTPADFEKGIKNKLLGQINLVLIGQHYINPKGSFTLTSGFLSDEPARNTSNLSTINGAINTFAYAASVELNNDVRINAVSPGIAEDTPQYLPSFPGYELITMERIVNAYKKSVLGALNGQVFRVF